jgi:hypothetical protein
VSAGPSPVAEHLCSAKVLPHCCRMTTVQKITAYIHERGGRAAACIPVHSCSPRKECVACKRRVSMQSQNNLPRIPVFCPQTAQQKHVQEGVMRPSCAVCFQHIECMVQQHCRCGAIHPTAPHSLHNMHNGYITIIILVPGMPQVSCSVKCTLPVGRFNLKEVFYTYYI